jgi:hypothetical protein
VVEADLDPKVGQVIGIHEASIPKFRPATGEGEFPYWLSVCLDLERGEEVRVACVRALRTLTPVPEILVSGIRLGLTEMPRPGDPWRLAAGAAVPAAVVKAVLVAVRKIHSGPLVLVAGGDAPGIISVGPVCEGDPPPADEATLARLADPGQGLEAMQATLPPNNSRPLPEPALIIDLDLCAANGVPPAAAASLRCRQVTWTAEGLYLPGRRLPRTPARFPTDPVPSPIPVPPYTAEIPLPLDGDRAVTVTLLVCLASSDAGQDNLFTIGRRSRWLAAHLGATGQVVVGLDNRWDVRPFDPAKQDGSPAIADKAWHALTIVHGGPNRAVGLVVDGVAFPDRLRDPAHGSDRFTPRRLTGGEEDVLAFADPGSGRHLHGLVRRLVVHRGLLPKDAILDLHRRLAPRDLPDAKHLLQPVAELPQAPETGPVGADRF